MKKLMLSLVIMFAFSCPVCANVYVYWYADSGFYELGGGGGSLFTVGSGQSVLAQLIWSEDDVADPAMFGAANYVSGDDVWLADFLVTEGTPAAGSEWANFSAPVFDDGGAQDSGGYIYARIFESETPQVDDWYYAGPVISASNLDPGKEPPDSPQDYDMNRNYGDRLDGTYGAQVQPVPEPGTMALMALGVATLAMRRRRKA